MQQEHRNDNDATNLDGCQKDQAVCKWWFAISESWVWLEGLKDEKEEGGRWKILIPTGATLLSGDIYMEASEIYSVFIHSWENIQI